MSMVVGREVIKEEVVFRWVYFWELVEGLECFIVGRGEGLRYVLGILGVVLDVFYFL